VRARRLAAALALVATAGALAPSTPGLAAPLHPGPDDVVDVKIDDNFYRPKKIKVRAGTTIRWTNEGRNEHNVLPDMGKRFGVADIDPDATYEHRFDKPGRYGYYCSVHGAPRTGQFGTVVVKRAQAERDTQAKHAKGGRGARSSGT